LAEQPRWRIVSADARVEPRSRDLAEGPGLVIGRAEDCDVRVVARRVSKQHARVRLHAGRVELTDLGSSDGTQVQGEAVQRVLLDAGDRFELGGVRFELRGPPGAGGRSARASSGREVGPLFEALTGLLARAGGEDRALQTMLDRLLQTFGADRGSVLVPGEDEDFEALASRVRPGGGVEEGTHVSRRVLERVTKGGEALLLSDAETEALRLDVASIPGELRAMLVAPLPLPEAPGALYLDGSQERRRFTAADAELLRAFAAAAGVAVQREWDRAELERSRDAFADLQGRRLEEAELLGDSPAIRHVARELETAATTTVSVLVTGESGTGKELAAQLLHRASERARGPFVSVNCAALPRELVEAELFGHEKGAFTGADRLRRGRFELAHQGTLFLDEVGELSAEAQGKLLRALESRRITRVGGREEIPVDLRLVAATHRDLEAEVAAGRFRADLLYRLAVFRVQLPPLRERGDDVLRLARAFAVRDATRYSRPAQGLSEEAEALLMAHDWPGNVRELANLIEQAVVREEGPAITPSSLRSGFSELPGEGEAGRHRQSLGAMGAYPVAIEQARRAFERAFLEHHLQRLGGNMTQVAEAIGIARRNLYVKCDELGVDYRAFRA